MSSVLSVSSTSVLNIELMALTHTKVSAKMIVKPVPDFRGNEKHSLTYMSLHCTVIHRRMDEMSHQLQEIEYMAAVSKKYVTIPETSESCIKAKDVIQTMSYTLSPRNMIILLRNPLIRKNGVRSVAFDAWYCSA